MKKGFTITMPPFWDLQLIMSELEETMRTGALTGICCACGEEQDGCEPDAVGYKCQHCGAEAVCGVEIIFMALA